MEPKCARMRVLSLISTASQLRISDITKTGDRNVVGAYHVWLENNTHNSISSNSGFQYLFILGRQSFVITNYISTPLVLRVSTRPKLAVTSRTMTSPPA